MKTEDAINHFGGVGRLAKVLNISRHAIYQWGDEVPPLRAYEIEEITYGKLKHGAKKQETPKPGRPRRKLLESA